MHHSISLHVYECLGGAGVRGQEAAILIALLPIANPAGGEESWLLLVDLMGERLGVATKGGD
jgi:hypothetical protein